MVPDASQPCCMLGASSLCSALLHCSDLLQIIVFSLLLGDTPTREKLTQMGTVRTVGTVGMVETFEPIIYNV